MASDGVPVIPPALRLVHGSRALTSATGQDQSGKTLPAGGNSADAAAQIRAQTAQTPQTPQTAQAAAARARANTDLQAQIDRLNKNLRDSGRTLQFRLNSSSGRTLIQEINPDSGAVVGELPAAEFPSLAQGLGYSGLLIDRHA
jgi:uncharacterized FlaG/YvyC family protein